MQVITTHTGADFDALASLLVASYLYPDAHLFIPGSAERKVREYLNREGFPGKLAKFKDLRNESLKLLVVVDTRLKNRIGRVADLIRKTTEVHLYDHHPASSSDMKGKINIKKNYGATTTILIEKIKKEKIKMTPKQATLAALGIYEDTGCLTYPLTTPSDLKAAAYLLSRGADLRKISEYAKQRLNLQQLELLESMLEKRTFIDTASGRVFFIEAELDEYIENLAVVIHKAMDILRPTALFAFLKIKEKVLCIGRSQSSGIAVDKVLSAFGGGGHPTAASASSEMSVKKLKEKIMETILKKSEGEVEAPVVRHAAKVIPFESSADMARHTLTHLNLEYAPVGDVRGRLLGVVRKSELEKACRHGMGSHPVIEFTFGKVSSVSEDADYREKQEAVNSGEYSFAVLEKKGKITGILEKKNRFSTQGYTPEIRFIPEKAVKNLRAESARIIRKAAGIADDMNIKAFCVGGMVRDILMENPHKDVDIVVERKGIEFAGKLAAEYGKKPHVHKKFKTAVFKAENIEVDIATLRREYYEFPGALPSVEKGTLLQDLHRRDFSINAMAIQINPSDKFGKLIDYFGGLNDLKAKKIKILYPLSFVEDPTRIFRGVRFEKRFGFTFTRETLKQLKRTVDISENLNVSADRIREELIYIFSEKKPHEILKRLSEIPALSIIHKDLKITDENYLNIRNFMHLRDAMPREVSEEAQKFRNPLILMFLISSLKFEKMRRVVCEFNFKRKYLNSCLNIKNRVPQLIRILGEEVPPARVFKSLHFLDKISVFYALTAGDKTVRKKIVLYLTKLRHVTTEINGSRLREMGIKQGPIYSRILFTLKLARLNLKISTEKEEISFIKNRFSEFIDNTMKNQ